MMKMPATSALLVAFGCALTHSLQLPALARPLQLPTRHRSIVASVAEDPESEEARRARLEAIGREEAERNQYLDSAPADDGGLMAEFQARIDAEGGTTAFKVKSGMNSVKEEASETARRAQNAGADLVNKLPSPNLTEQQQNVGKVILGLIAFQVLIGFISNAMVGGGGGYSV